MGFLSKLKLDLGDARLMLKTFKHGARFNPKGEWSSSRLLQERVESRPDDIALCFEEQRHSWREVDARVNQYVRFFQGEGIATGDVVALLMDNRPDFLFIITALNRLRAVAALINPNITGPALVHAIKVATPRAALVGGERSAQFLEVASDLGKELALRWHQAPSSETQEIEGLRPIAEAVDGLETTRPEGLESTVTTDPFCYIYTSGTTGLPKAAIITNGRYLAAAYMFGASVTEATHEDVVYAPLPLYHSSGLYIGWGTALTRGASLAIRRKFSASNFWADVKRFDASVFVYIGELCRYLLNQPQVPEEQGHRLRVAVGNGLRPDIWEEFQERFGVGLVREFYGATEGNAPIVNFKGRPGMIGRLRRGQVVVRCDLSTGEILRNEAGFCEAVSPGEKGLLIAKITKLMRFDGYVDRKASAKKVLEGVFETEDRYFNSGDILETHEDGWVAFADRIGDTFRFKGENVSTNEVAETLNGAAQVLESNVYGVEVPGVDGRVGMASVNVDEGFDVASFAAHVLDKLAAYQRPYFLRLQKDMQTTTTLKHRKVDYRDEGFDPTRVSDPLFLLEGGCYVPIDEGLFAQIQSGEVAPGAAARSAKAPSSSGEGATV